MVKKVEGECCECGFHNTGEPVNTNIGLGEYFATYCADCGEETEHEVTAILETE